MEKPDTGTADKILLVDDNPINLQVVGKLLKMEGYRISMVFDGFQCLENAGCIQPDLILLDIIMPRMNGFTVCEKLKENPRTRRIPVIFMTAYKIQPDDIVKGFESGAADYVTKPFNTAELLARVRTHLELKKLRDHLEEEAQQRTKELEETNVALNVLLKKREADRQEMEERTAATIHELILPFVEKLKNSELKSVQKAWVDAIDQQLNEIASAFARTISSKHYNLTPTEMQVAVLVRQGKTSKEIAHLLYISESVVKFHRENIRKKFRLTHKKINLKTFLQSLS